MKPLIAIFISLATALNFSFADWERSDMTGVTGGNFNSVAYGDGVFVVANGFGRVARSTDGGKTFTQVLDAGGTVEDIEYGSNGTANVFWLTGRGSGDFLYESTDGGQTWADIASSFSFISSDGGADIAVDASGNLIYTKLRGNNGLGDSFLFGATYYNYGGGPDSSLSTSSDGETFTEVVADTGEWINGGIVIGSDVLIYGVVFETPGDFSTRKGAIFDLTTDPTQPSNPVVANAGATGYISDIDQSEITATTYHAVAQNALLTSTDSGVTWMIDPLGTDVSVSDMGEMVASEEALVAVGASGVYYWTLENSGGSATWMGYSVDENDWVDTEDWLGLVYVKNDPYIWVEGLSAYIYFPSDTSWAFVPKE